MVMTAGVARGSMVIGCALLALTLISVICGGVTMSKMTSPAGVSVGLWGLYFAIPGVLCILTGHKKLPSMLVVALGVHILGIIIAIVGMSIAAALWAILSSTCIPRHLFVSINADQCVCVYKQDTFIYDASCSDLETVRNACAAVTVVFALFAICSFVGSIYGCIGTCCGSRDPVVVVTTTQPNTVVMTSTNQQGLPPAYGQPGKQ